VDSVQTVEVIFVIERLVLLSVGSRFVLFFDDCGCGWGVIGRTLRFRDYWVWRLTFEVRSFVGYEGRLVRCRCESVCSWLSLMGDFWSWWGGGWLCPRSFALWAFFEWLRIGAEMGRSYSD
jgi:hypothetical protein